MRPQGNRGRSHRVKRASASAATLHATVSEAHKQSSAIVTEMATIQAETERLSHKAALEPSDFDALKSMEAAHFQAEFAHEMTLRSGVAQSVTVQTDTKDAEKEAVEMVPQAKATDKQTAASAVEREQLRSDATHWQIIRRTLWAMAIVAVLFFLLWLFVKLRPLIPL